MQINYWYYRQKGNLNPWTKRHKLCNALANFGAKLLILCTNLNCKLFQVRLLPILIIHHKFSLPSPYQVLVSFAYMKLQWKRNVCCNNGMNSKTVALEQGADVPHGPLSMFAAKLNITRWFLAKWPRCPIHVQNCRGAWALSSLWLWLLTWWEFFRLVEL